jgi:hypothetical protein
MLATTTVALEAGVLSFGQVQTQQRLVMPKLVQAVVAERQHQALLGYTQGKTVPPTLLEILLMAVAGLQLVQTIVLVAAVGLIMALIHPALQVT